MNITKTTSLKYKVIIGLKIFILLWILVFLIVTFTASYLKLLSVAINLMIMYLIFTLVYFSFLAEKEERIVILNMWKVYFSVVTIMFIFMYSTESNLRKDSLDYQKTKLDYELRTNSNNINKTFFAYSNIVTQHLNSNKQEKLIDISKVSIRNKKEKVYTLWYANLSVSVIIIITLFMFLWSLIELKFFQYKRISKKSDFLKIKLRK
ncbi:MAG: hypothetical protein HRT41_06225 [Campylobacteraceae bacterium]|nr:hypothetical protein [Campylobacteraceae bacterium]